MNAIEIKNVSKRYKDVTALDDVSLSFEYGKIYGFLGRNGAGKSTLINIMQTESLLIREKFPSMAFRERKTWRYTRSCTV